MEWTYQASLRRNVNAPFNGPEGPASSASVTNDRPKQTLVTEICLSNPLILHQRKDPIPGLSAMRTGTDRCARSTNGYSRSIIQELDSQYKHSWQSSTCRKDCLVSSTADRDMSGRGRRSPDSQLGRQILCHNATITCIHTISGFVGHVSALQTCLWRLHYITSTAISVQWLSPGTCLLSGTATWRKEKKRLHLFTLI